LWRRPKKECQKKGKKTRKNLRNVFGRGKKNIRGQGRMASPDAKREKKELEKEKGAQGSLP